MENIFKSKKILLFEENLLPYMKKVVFLQPENGGTVAQLVEQRTENPRVTGSIPVGTTPKEKPAAKVGFFVLAATV